jgi:glycosyltransferase involved in cell wall biosynthesis
MISSLFLMHCGSNEGYAIERMERAFFDVGVQLAAGNPEGVHFSYPELLRGAPRSLPTDFPNVIRFDPRHYSQEELARLTSFVKERQIDIAIPFDLQPIHPVNRALRRAGVRTIVGYWGAPISSPSSFFKLMAKRAEVWLSSDGADGLIFESKALAELAVTGRGYPKRRIDVVPLGVDLERYTPGASSNVHAMFGFPQSRRIIVSAGHVYEGKGVGILIEAALELLENRGREDVCFLMLGNRAQEHLPFEARYAGRHCSSLIRFGGYRTDVAEILRGCFCGVVPSLVPESFAFSSVEFAASGLPVVASRIGGLTDSVVDGETGTLVRPGDHLALADALERLLDSPDHARELGLAGRQRCQQEFSLAIHRSRLFSVFRRRIDESQYKG